MVLPFKEKKTPELGPQLQASFSSKTVSHSTFTHIQGAASKTTTCPSPSPLQILHNCFQNQAHFLLLPLLRATPQAQQPLPPVMQEHLAPWPVRPPLTGRNSTETSMSFFTSLHGPAMNSQQCSLNPLPSLSTHRPSNVGSVNPCLPSQQQPLRAETE